MNYPKKDISVKIETFSRHNNYTMYYYMNDKKWWDLHNEDGPADLTPGKGRWYLFGCGYRTISGLLKLLSLTSEMVKILAPNWDGKSLKASLLISEIIKNNNFSKLNKAQKAKIYKLGDNYLTRKLYGGNEEWKDYMIIKNIIN